MGIAWDNISVMKYTIGQIADHFGVRVETIRRWEKEGRIKSERTRGGHRRYSLVDLDIKPGSKTIKAVCYARVSTKNKKDDLGRQVRVLENFCNKNGYRYEIIQDIGSGLNYKKKGLIKLIDKIQNRDFDKLIINYKDRLLRFGSEIIFRICELNGIELEIINESEDKTYQEELVDDVLSVITVFSSRLYGSRSHKNKQIVKTNKELFGRIK